MVLRRFAKLDGCRFDHARLRCEPGRSIMHQRCHAPRKHAVGQSLHRRCGAYSCSPIASIPREDQTDRAIEQLCDNCFVQMLYARVTSPYLDDSDQSDFLVSQLQDIGDVCNITIPEITIRALPSYADAPMPTSIDFESTATSTISSAAATTTCDGQIIASGSGCAALSTKYGLTTGDLQKLTGSDTCVISASTCFPAACTLGAVPTGATW